MNDDFLFYKNPEASYRLVLLHGWGASAEDLFPLGMSIMQEIDLSLELVSFNAPFRHPQGFGRQWYGLFPPEWEAVPAAMNSQGAAMAIGVGCDLPLLGIIGCSGYMHPDWVPPLLRPPVVLSHGKSDDVVPSKASIDLLNSLEKGQNNVDLLLFEGGHEIPEKFIPQFQSFIRKWCLSDLKN